MLPCSTRSLPAVICLAQAGSPLLTYRKRFESAPASSTSGKYRWCDCMAVISTSGGSAQMMVGEEPLRDRGLLDQEEHFLQLAAGVDHAQALARRPRVRSSSQMSRSRSR